MILHSSIFDIQSFFICGNYPLCPVPIFKHHIQHRSLCFLINWQLIFRTIILNIQLICLLITTICYFIGITFNEIILWATSMQARGCNNSIRRKVVLQNYIQPKHRSKRVFNISNFALCLCIIACVCVVWTTKYD